MKAQSRSTFQFFKRNPCVASYFRGGVSLHSHTMHSEESLEMLPHYVRKVPVLRRALDRQVAYAELFWTPPLSPRQAHRLEEKQIQRSFALPALVSLTDHDSVHAGTLLRVLDRFRDAPISTEWTVPYGSTFFHLGVHNLPATHAGGIMCELAAFTANPDPGRLAALLADLNSYRDLLIVVNHPLWDEKRIGVGSHRRTLDALLEKHGGALHALELNGLRSPVENRHVINLAKVYGLPVVSGGDRHGREPNAILNLTRGSTFAEFIHELRYERQSHIVFMPQYEESLKLRTMQMVVDILREYPENPPGRRFWAERVFYRNGQTAEPVTLASVWPRGKAPAVFDLLSIAVRVAQWRGVQSMLRVAI